MTDRDAAAGKARGHVLVRREGPIGWLIYSQPKKHNALSLDMQAAVPALVEELVDDPEIRVVVLRGEGEKAFISGADISEFDRDRSSAGDVERFDQVFDRASRALLDCDKPVIAMIHGYCIGGGLATALLADLRIAADDALFAIPAAKLGLGYGVDGVKRLVDVVGPAYASEILFSAESFDAESALQMRLINRVVKKEELEALVREVANTMARRAPLTQRAAKAAIRNALRDHGQRDVEHCERLIRACFESADYTEGRRAFAEKRQPVFRGR